MRGQISTVKMLTGHITEKPSKYVLLRVYVFQSAELSNIGVCVVVVGGGRGMGCVMREGERFVKIVFNIK